VVRQVAARRPRNYIDMQKGVKMYIAPEIPGYAQSIIKSAMGTRAEVRSFRWADGGGLYNKVYCLDTSEGSFILKIECDNIFPSTRKGQIENEVEGSRLLKQVGVLCPPVVAYDCTGKEIGVRYCLTECLSDDWPVMARMDQMDGATRAEVKRQAAEMLVRIATVTNTHFGSLSPSGPLGWHKTWNECYSAWFSLLISDCVSIGLFTGEELAAVNAAAAKPLNYSGNPAPVFSSEDMGWHNMIWGRAGDNPDALYAFDFGNARYILPYMNDYLIKNIDAMGRPPFQIPEFQSLDTGYNLLILYDFEGMLWKEAERLAEDYAHIRGWMAAGIERSKRDASRGHITAFVEKCKAVVQNKNTVMQG